MGLGRYQTDLYLTGRSRWLRTLVSPVTSSPFRDAKICTGFTVRPAIGLFIGLPLKVRLLLCLLSRQRDPDGSLAEQPRLNGRYWQPPERDVQLPVIAPLGLDPLASRFTFLSASFMRKSGEGGRRRGGRERACLCGARRRWWPADR